MQTKMAKLCNKAVVVSVYEEKPTKRKLVDSSKNQHHHHHHHHHHYFVVQGGHRGGGDRTNRRAQLLLYSQSLRESVHNHPPQSSHLHPIPKPLSSDILQPTQNVGAVQRKKKHDKTPTCLGNWKFLNLKLCRLLTDVQIKKDKKKRQHSVTPSNAMKAVMKTLEVQKKKGFVAKFISMLNKSRKN
ncbi:uncharacterized protein LOC126677838 isoform X2 [Mercurialis annua]|uniref:uncharacterized protein LOC126677838 isoform X2 n=1 Tax=Mercurialis annua TaxID=3986 RepID=UPI002160AB5F|nr:uncharacterized protein LOC126677838 isoform X2 [Mercurialis annua]